MKGWGTEKWGICGWGVPGACDVLAIITAEAIRENLVRITFNLPVRYTDVRGLVDAADPENYAIDPVSSTLGADGLPARPVFPILVEQASVEGANGRVLDIWTDRRLSPYPAEYTFRLLKSVAANGAPITSFTPARFFGLEWDPPVPANATTPATDIANPGFEAIPGASQILGVYPVTSTGDYATDQGLVSYKKRIIRRLTTRRGAFAHLPSYGVGLLDEVKRLALPATQRKLAAEAEAQIKQEPETVGVEVTISADTRQPGIFIFRVRARTRTFGSVSLDIPVSAGGI